MTTPQSLTPVKSLLEKLEQEHGGRLPGQLSRLPHNSKNDTNSFFFSQHLLYPELASLALSKPLLDTVSLLLGPDLVNFISTTNLDKLGQPYDVKGVIGHHPVRQISKLFGARREV